jgi:6-pyruvoyltetrahydropterin/6-carboxytetrahydropterin synthase
MYIITKEFSFEASHCLSHLTEGHPCRNVHGHSYKVIIELKSNTLDEFDMVKDYRELSWIKSWLDFTFDHKHLNEVFDKENLPTTSENIAEFIYMCIKKKESLLSAVTVKETDKTSARYEE